MKIKKWKDTLLLVYSIYTIYETEKESIKSIDFDDIEYKNGAEIESMEYNFFENGNIAMSKYNFLTNEVERREGQFNVDSDSNWDIYPEFGKYDHLLKIERE